MRITNPELLSVLDLPGLNPLSSSVHAFTTSMAMQVRQPILKTTSIAYRDVESKISEFTPPPGNGGDGRFWSSLTDKKTEGKPEMTYKPYLVGWSCFKTNTQSTNAHAHTQASGQQIKPDRKTSSPPSTTTKEGSLCQSFLAILSKTSLFNSLTSLPLIPTHSLSG